MALTLQRLACNTERPHSALGYKPQTPFAIVPPSQATSNAAERPTMH
jgi:hypothetical protein